MTRVLIWLMAVVMMPAAVLAQGAREVDLRPKFAPGQLTRFKLELTNSSEPVAAVAPKPATPGATRPAPERTSSKVEYSLSLRVVLVSPDREATVNLVFDAVKMSTTNKEGTVEFDSTKPAGVEDDLVAGLLRPLVGSTLTLKVDKAGNITGITGGESFSALG